MLNEASSDVKISKKSWSKDEDQKLLSLIDVYGVSGSWTAISNYMGNRSGKQCRERYHNHLKPGIQKTGWTKEEDAFLNQTQKEMGNKWADIAKLLPGRSDNSVKNRWHIINRKKSNSAARASLKATSKEVAKKPVIPKLALSNLGADSPNNNTKGIVSDTYLTLPDQNDDLLSFYTSHDSHCHEPTDSTRSDKALLYGKDTVEVKCPGSGRRDVGTTCAAPSDFFKSDFEVPVNVKMDFHNTLNSCISELTGVSFKQTDIDDDEGDEDSWIDDLIVGNPTGGDAMKKDHEVQHVEILDTIDFSETDVGLNFDQFSEPALSYREEVDIDLALQEEKNGNVEFHTATGTAHSTDEELYESSIDEECCDLFMVDCFNGDSATTVSFDKTVQQGKFESKLHLPLYKELTPRTTPRSPMCAHVKRRRGGITPRSPYKMVTMLH